MKNFFAVPIKRLHRVRSLTLPCCLAIACLAVTPWKAESEEEPDAKAAKYHEALVKRPSGGYLFERFYHAWLDRGTVAGLEDFLTRRAAAADAAPGEALLLAYFFSEQGQDEKALAIFEKTLAADPVNAEAWLEKAKVLTRLQQFDAAISDLDKVAGAEPKEEVAIEAGKLKGRLLARAGRSEEARGVWSALAKEHADDDELQEDLVDLHLDEGLIEEAVALMESLIGATSDAYLEVTRQLRLGDIFQRTGEREKAIALYDQCLANSGRDTWLEKEILAQIEHVFRREDDLAGLKKHFSELIEKETGRIALRKRQARLHAESKEVDEAIAAFTEVLKLTPGDRANREEYITLLGQLERHGEAAEQMAALAALHPEDAEMFAQLAVRYHRAEKKAEAMQSVDDFLAKSDRSEYSHLRAARLFEQFEASEEAARIYETLVTTFPESIAAKESQAEFLHRSEKKEAAIVLWKTIATTGTGSDALRAARALGTRGEHAAAYEILKARADEFKGDFLYLGQLVNEALAVENFEEALDWSEERLALAANPVDLTDAMRQTLTSLERVGREAAHRDELAAKPDRSLTQTCLLAEMLERDGQYEAAQKTLEPALEAGEILAITQQVRLFRSREEWVKAAETQERILDLKEGRQSANLQELVVLLRRAEKHAEALTRIEEWKTLSPGATLPWTEQSSVLMEMDKPDEAVQTLRTAVQKFEDIPEMRAQLASLYARQGALADAERIYWTLYEESEDIGQKIGWAGSLADVATISNRADKLVEQFEERKKTNRTSIAPLLAIAEIHRRDNNHEARREALLEATRLRPEDLKLLHEIARIEEQEGDWDAAKATLESALPLDPTDGTRSAIAQITLRYGDEEEGFRQVMELAGGEVMEVKDVIALADAMMTRQQWERASEFLGIHRARFPDDYRLAYLETISRLEAGEENAAREGFLSLLDWKVEAAKPAGPVNPQAAAIAASLASREKYFDSFPVGLTDFYDPSNATYYAMAYRETLRRGSVQFRRNPSMGGSAALVKVPSDLTELRSFSTAHLLSLAQELPPEEQTGLGREMLARGIKSADIRVKMPVRNPYSNQSSEFPVELLEEYPDRLDLLAFAYLNQASGATPDLELLQQCYERFRADYPGLALAVAISAAASGNAEGADLLRSALLAAPASLDLAQGAAPLQMIAANIRTSIPFYSQAASNLPEEFLPALAKIYFDYTKLARADPELQKTANAEGSFSFGDPGGWIYRNSGDFDGFSDYLDGEIVRYETFQRENPSRAPVGTSDLLRQISWVTQNRALLAPLEFPPIILTDMPGSVLIHFASFPQYGTQTESLDPEKIGPQRERAKHPILRAIFAHLGEDEAAAEKEITGMLAAESETPGRILQTRLFAASYFAAVKQDPSKASTLLEEARSQPMSKEMRRSIDSFLVTGGVAMVNNQSVAPDDPSLAPAKAAALRLRYGVADPNQRVELVEALKTLGLTGEAERLEQKATLQLTSGSVTRTSNQSVARDLGEQVKKLIADNKRDAALKLSLASLRPSIKQMAATAVGQIDYELINFLRAVKSDAALLGEIKKEFEPADPAAATSDEWFQWATLGLLLDDSAEALKSYRIGLEGADGKKRAVVESRITAILARIYPKEAAIELAGMDPAGVQRFAGELTWMGQAAGYSSNDDSFPETLNLGRMVTAWLVDLEDSDFDTLDLSWVYEVVLSKLSEQNYGEPYLPDLFYNNNPHSSWSFSSSQIEAAKKKEAERQEIYLDCCIALLRSPQAAREACSSLLGLRMHADGAGSLAEPQLEAYARQAMESADRRLRGNPLRTSQQSMYASVATIPRWSPEEFLLLKASLARDAAGAAAIVEAAKQSKDRDRYEEAKRSLALAFGTAEELAATAKTYLNSFNVSNQNYGRNEIYLEQSAIDAPAKLLTLLESRDDFGSESDLENLVFDLAKSRTLPAALAPIRLIERKFRAEGGAATRPLLDRFTVAMLGERETWKQFRKTPQTRIPQAGGGYSTRGGEFTSPAHGIYANAMKRLCQDPGTALFTAGYLVEHGLDENQQITDDTVAERIVVPRLAEDAELAIRLFESSPFFGDVTSFRSLTFGESNTLGKILDLLRKSGTTRPILREVASTKGTYGGDLVAAYLSENPKIEFANALAKHRSGIDSRVPGGALLELAPLAKVIYGGGGVDYATLPEAARSLLEALGTERMKSAKEAADEFLALEKLTGRDLERSYTLEPYLRKIMQPLWEAKEWDQVAAVYWHGMDLVREKIKAGQWTDSNTSGWNIEGDGLYDIFNGADGSDLERIVAYQRIVLSDKEGRIPLTFDGRGFGADMRAAFNRAGGEAVLEKALDTLAAGLHEPCGDEAAVMLSACFMELTSQLRPALIPKVVAWADARSEGRPWSALAREVGQVVRMGIQTHSQAQINALAPRVPNVDSWQAHYVAILQDDSRPLPWRLAVADEVCDNNAKLRPETVFTCGDLLARAMLADAPMNTWHVLRLARQFNSLPRTPEWEALAVQLCDGWTFKNRNNHKSEGSGLRFVPFGETVLALLETHLLLGDEERIEKFRIEKNAFEKTKSDARTVVTFVKYGHFEGAAHALREGMQFQDAIDDYTIGISDFPAKYSQTLHEQIPRFLETVENPALRYFAEVLLLGAFDPAPADREPEATYPPRGARLSEAARRFESIDFENADQGGLLRSRSLEQIASIDPAAAAIMTTWEKDYRPGRSRELLSLDNYKLIEHGSRPLAAYAALRLRKGDTSIVDDFLLAVNESPNDTYYREEGMEHFTSRLIDSLKFRTPTATPEEIAAYAISFGNLLTGPKIDSIRQHDTLLPLLAAYFTTSALAGREAELIEWCGQLDPKFERTLADKIRQQMNPFWTALQQILKVKSPDPKQRPTPEMREQVLRIVFAAPLLDKAIGSHEDLFRPLIEQGMLTKPEMLSETGARLEAAFRRGGWAAAEIARAYADDGQFDEAITWSGKSVTVSDPLVSTVRYTRVYLRHADLLIEAGKPDLAAKALADLVAVIDETKLPENVREELAKTRSKM